MSETRIDPSAVGTTTGPLTRSWTDRDTLLYALGIGCGTGDLAFTTENSTGVEHRVLPTFGVVVCHDPALLRAVGTLDMRKLVHGEQRLRQHRPLPGSGTLNVTGRVESIVDKGPGRNAVLTLHYTGADQDSGAVLVESETVLVVRGGGGFGGDPGTTGTHSSTSDGTPDVEVRTPIREDAALLYRLSGDRNRLHSDPDFAQRAGFAAPILHGLCSYGMAARVLLRELCDDDPARFGSVSARFSAPVYPGETLTTRICRTGPTDAAFTARVGEREVLTGGAVQHGVTAWTSRDW